MSNRRVYFQTSIVSERFEVLKKKKINNTISIAIKLLTFYPIFKFYFIIVSIKKKRINRKETELLLPIYKKTQFVII